MIEKLQIGMSLEDFIERYDREPFELIDGEMIPMSPPLLGHSEISHRLYNALLIYALRTNLGEPRMETPFVLPDANQTNWVEGSRVPDVMFLYTERLNAYKQSTPNWKDKPLLIVPELAVEIVSKNDSYTDVNDKVTRYLNDGVRLVWVIDPKRRTVTVHKIDSKEYTTLDSSDTLSGESVIPDFTMLVRNLFD